MSDALNRLKEIGRELTLLSHTGAILGWDQETYMPPAGIEERGEQLALLQGYMHEKLTAEETGRALESLGVKDLGDEPTSDIDPTDAAFVRYVAREYFRNTKLPKDLVTRIAKQVSRSQAVWIEARKTNDFPKFAPELQKILDLTLERAGYIGYTDHPYDALIDEFEPFMTTAEVARVFKGMRNDVASLAARIAEAKQVDDSFLLKKYPVDMQEAFGKRVLKDMGYEETRGRLDVTAHPFTTTLGVDDVRVTTRYNEDFWKTGLYGIIHEGGHGLYELGFGEGIRGNMLATGTSLGIHESQSRTWENMIGRSRSFWVHYLPILKEYFPDQLAQVDVDAMYHAVNKVAPSLIRVEADEVTYGLHIILRFELETQLVTEKLAIADLPEAWNDTTKDLLGITPPSNADGVLQDIHWSMGAIGYFPTYALGNLYGAQFYGSMAKDLPSIDELVSEGKFAPILGWLRDKIHVHGAAKSADELCREVTGSPLDPSHYVAYLEKKYTDIYGL